MIEVAITNEQSNVLLRTDRLRRAVQMIVQEKHGDTASISVAVVDDSTIHQLNQKYLQHDYPTDVLSFELDRTENTLDGEVIVSADTAATSAKQYGWKVDDELLLYVIHGTLHLVGLRDKSPAEVQQMRAAEAEYLARFDLVPHTQDLEASGEYLTPSAAALEGELKR
jgi:probable rRNA maturation factor